MKSYDYEAVVYDSAEYCVECLPEGVNVNDEEVHPIFADYEMDREVVCDVCGAVHDYMTILTEQMTTDIVTIYYVCRDIGYGIEQGEATGTWGPRDWTGKRKFRRIGAPPLYLFDDEIVETED